MSAQREQVSLRQSEMFIEADQKNKFRAPLRAKHPTELLHIPLLKERLINF